MRTRWQVELWEHIGSSKEETRKNGKWASGQFRLSRQELKGRLEGRGNSRVVLQEPRGKERSPMTNRVGTARKIKIKNAHWIYQHELVRDLGSNNSSGQS